VDEEVNQDKNADADADGMNLEVDSKDEVVPYDSIDSVKLGYDFIMHGLSAGKFVCLSVSCSLDSRKLGL